MSDLSRIGGAGKFVLCDGRLDAAPSNDTMTADGARIPETGTNFTPASEGNNE
ncbi:MAG TPA: hypothetical protein VGI28_12275 [Stellaceae bacterium]|jgi:hypothetical protein